MNLEWYKESAGLFTWEEALKYCQELGNGWRLPTIKELISAINYDKINPASDLDVLSSYYWSSTTYASYPDYMRSVNFYNGNVGYYGKSDNLYVRAVREDGGGNER